jgi:phosphate-selective porin OprO/OprP
MNILIRFLFLAGSALSVSAWAGDSGPWVPIDFDNGISFNHPNRYFDVAMRFRSQNLLQYDSALGTRDSRITGQPRRLRLRLGGWAVDEALRFSLQLAFTRGDMDWDNTEFPNVVRDAAVMFRISPAWELGFGQTKLPGNRQRVVSSGDMQFIDRSIVNRAYNLDRDFGLQTRFRVGKGEDPILALMTALSTGGGRNTGARDADSHAITARAELLPFGEFQNNGDYFEGDLLFEEKPKLSIGVLASRFGGIDRSGGTILNSLRTGSQGRGFTTWGWDAVLKHRGISVYLEYLKKTLINWKPALADFSATPSSFSAPLDGEGFNGQMGYVIQRVWEPVVRYSVVTPETVNLSAFAYQQKQFTVGLNRYLRGHRVKVQADLSRSAFAVPESSAEALGQWTGRFQVELGI